ncbi:hypothetical protein N185_16805 [Sinorhizobium sp. GW3]|nr:hypothetical protein N185_16805 [Sinorhizobium sp. GW3]
MRWGMNVIVRCVVMMVIMESLVVMPALQLAAFFNQKAPARQNPVAMGTGDGGDAIKQGT